MFNTTILGTPSYLSPMNVEFNTTYTLNNLGSTADNFKYVVKLYEWSSPSGPTQSLGRELIVPRPINGRGKYSPFKSILPELTYDLQLINGTGIFGGISNNSLSKYWIEYGYSYDPNLDITLGNIQQVIIGSSSFFGFTFSSPHNLEIGDTINISTQNPFFGGTSSIVPTGFGTFSFVTDRIFSSASNVSIGIINNAERFNGTSSEFWGFNGRRQYSEINFPYEDNYIINGVNTGRKFLTKYENNSIDSSKKVKSGQWETISLIVDGNSWTGNTTSNVYNFYNNSKAIIGSFSSSQSISGDLLRRISYIGPQNLINATITIPTGTRFYSFQIKNILGLTSSEVKFYEIDDQCSEYKNVRLMFLNSLGGFDFWNFELDDKKSYTVTRNEYKKELDFEYNIGDRERTIMSQIVKEQHVINTNWIIEDDYNFLSEELMISPEVYVIDEDNGNIFPIIITDNNVMFKNTFRDKIFNLTLTYETSYDIRTQNM